MADDLKERFRALDSLRFAHVERPPLAIRASGTTVVDRRVTGGRRAAIAAFALIVAVAGLALALRAWRTPLVKPGPSPHLVGGRIVYAALGGHGWTLRTVRADGSDDERVSAALPNNAFHPSWSPDGAQFAFDAGPRGNKDIYVVNVDGSLLVKLTAADGWDYLPAWSPDGSRIAYVHTSGHNDDIWVMNADGSDPVRLTTQTNFDLYPSWSPDGTRIVFQSNRAGNNEIYVMNADGSDVIRLTDDPGFDGAPAWSPGGEEIAFSSDRDGPGIYLMDTSGSLVRKLTNDPQIGPLEPVWSPDGLRIVFTASPDSHSGTKVGIYVVELHSGKRTTLVDPGDACCPSWQPLAQS
jgi:Tol biopolymer transport system component